MMTELSVAFTSSVYKTDEMTCEGLRHKNEAAITLLQAGITVMTSGDK